MGILEDKLIEAMGGDPDEPAKCNKCGREHHRLEPDANIECKNDDCDGRVKSNALKHGVV